jgi:hypothetical protein
VVSREKKGWMRVWLVVRVLDTYPWGDLELPCLGGQRQ